MARPTIGDIFYGEDCTELSFKQKAYHTYQIFLLIKMAALLHRAGVGVDWFNPWNGICFNSCSDDLVLDFRGAFPVPGGVTSYYSSGDKWIGEYGDSRMKFLDDCLYALEKYLKL